MPEQREFKPIKEVGAIAISDTSELKFYVDEYKGYQYASIRTFVKGDNYSGPTKAGVTLNQGVLAGVVEALGKLPPEGDAPEEKELGRFPKRMGIELVLRITTFKEQTGIDLREWVEDQTYKGWSKKGVRIPYKDLGKALEYLKAMQGLIPKK